MSIDNDSMPTTRAERRARQSKKGFSAGHFLIFGVIAVVLLVVGSYAIHAYYTSTVEYRIAEAFKLIDKADVKMNALHQVIASDITDETAEQAKAARDSIEPTREVLRQAVDYIKKAQESATDEEMDRLTMIQESIAMRGKMLGLAPELLDVTEQSAVALKGVNTGWELLIEATEASIRAKEAFEMKDKAGMLESVKQNNEALSQLARARVEFNDAERTLEGLSFDVYLTYIDIREQMAQAAIKAANDWTADDKTALQIDVDHYAQLLVQATIMEENELVAPSVLVASIYQDLVGAISEEYFALREELLALDAKVR